MSTNRISVSIPDDVIAQAINALNQAKTLLQPYLQSLTVAERRALPKMSDKSFSFVSKVNDYSAGNPEFNPSFLDPVEFQKDFAAVAALKPVFSVCDQLCRHIDDTLLLAGSEAYTAALLYYSTVQAASKTGQANAKPIFEDLQQRFMRPSRKTAAPVAVQ